MSEKVVGVRIALRDVDPKIWRRVQLPTWVSLTTLHDVIELAFGWDGTHMAAFVVNREWYMASFGWGNFDENEPSSEDLSLQDVIDIKARGVRYIYDFGESWEHTITFGKVQTVDTPMEFPMLLGGARAAPLEDCGGLGTYYEYMNMLNSPDDYDRLYKDDDSHPVHWMKENDYDPERFDKDGLRKELQEIGLCEPEYPHGKHESIEDTDLYSKLLSEIAAEMRMPLRTKKGNK